MEQFKPTTLRNNLNWCNPYQPFGRWTLVLLTLVIQCNWFLSQPYISFVSGQLEGQPANGTKDILSDPLESIDVGRVQDGVGIDSGAQEVDLVTNRDDAGEDIGKPGDVYGQDSLKFGDRLMTEPKVVLPQGVFKGQSVIVQGVKVNVFKGVPYADPPIDELRFRPSQVISLISNETYLANDYRPNCWEPLLGPLDDLRRSGSLMVRSEDCLHLNIWSPSEKAATPNGLRPVVVYIHGGVLIMYSAGDSRWTDGQSLAALGNVVVVTVNYRLGTLGFLYSGDSDAPGNLGITDQLTALQWINENIEAFGGDPKRVTLYGMSSGALTISMLFLSGKINNLVSGLIVSSGGPSSMWIDSKEQSLLRFQVIASKLGCYIRGTKLETSRVLDCLRSKPALLLTGAAIDPENTILNGSGRNGVFFPTMESDLFPQESIDQLYMNRHWSPDIPVLIWVVSDEGYAPATYGSFPKLVNPTVAGCSQHLTATRYSLLPASVNGNTTMINDLSKTYCKGYETASGPAMLANFNTLLGDWYIVCPSYYFADILATSHPNPVYFGKFTYYNESLLRKYLSPDFTGGTYGARHGLDKLYMMGIPFTRPEEFSGTDRGQSYQLMNIYSRFAYTGNPGWTSYQVTSTGRVIPFIREVNSLNDIRFTSVNADRIKCHVWDDIFQNMGQLKSMVR